MLYLRKKLYYIVILGSLSVLFYLILTISMYHNEIKTTTFPVKKNIDKIQNLSSNTWNISGQDNSVCIFSVILKFFSSQCRNFFFSIFYTSFVSTSTSQNLD